MTQHIWSDEMSSCSQTCCRATVCQDVCVATKAHVLARKHSFNTHSFLFHRGARASQASHLEDDENVDAGQDDSSDGHLRLHVDVERLVGHGQRHHLVILQEGLDGNDDGVTRTQHHNVSHARTAAHWPWSSSSGYLLSISKVLVSSIWSSRSLCRGTVQL